MMSPFCIHANDDRVFDLFVIFPLLELTSLDFSSSIGLVRRTRSRLDFVGNSGEREKGVVGLSRRLRIRFRDG